MKLAQTIAGAIVLFAGLGLTACQSNISKDDTEFAKNAFNSLDWQGVYQGTFPCEGCAGIRTRITLYDSGEFSKTDAYLSNAKAVFTEHGDIEWDESGNRISLQGSESRVIYQVAENALIFQDIDTLLLRDEEKAQYLLQKTVTEQ